MATIPRSPGVYKITCTTTDKVYIGSTTNLRKRKGWHWGDLRSNRHHNRHLQFAWNKYEEVAFTFEVLEVVMFAEYLHDREQYWLDHFRAYDPKKGFNHGKIARAPWLGRSHSEETRQKLRERAKVNVTDEHLATIREAASEWHGSAAGQSWHSQQAKRVWSQRATHEKQCEYCGRSYQTFVPTLSRFCSGCCKNKSRYHSGLDDVDRVCEYCDVVFRTNKNSRTRFCSERCGARARFNLRGG